MSASICQRPSSIDRRDKRLGNGQARSRRHRIKRAVGPIRPRSFRVHANYLDALNASRVRIHRQKPKALGLKFGCGFTRHLFHQGSPASGSAAIFEEAKVALKTEKLDAAADRGYFNGEEILACDQSMFLMRSRAFAHPPQRSRGRPDSAGNVKKADLLRTRAVERMNRLGGRLQQDRATLFRKIRLSFGR